MTGLTIVAFMIAINTHGRLRSILSYSLAMLLFSLTAVVFINHTGVIISVSYRHSQLPSEPVEKGINNQRLLRPTESDTLSPESAQLAIELRSLSAKGIACANSLLNKDLKDESVELETLVGRASETRKRVESIKNEFEKISATDATFKKSVALIQDGIQLLSEAAQLYLQYYYSEDSSQEVTRENLLRQKARKANEQFQEAADLLNFMK
jgi:cell division protein FtsB